jgi:hypothetical protein
MKRRYLRSARAQNTTQKAISIVFLRKVLFVVIRHSASTLDSSSHPPENIQNGAVWEKAMDISRWVTTSV